MSSHNATTKSSIPGICTQVLQEHADLLDLLKRLDDYGVEAAEDGRYRSAEELYTDMLRAIDRCDWFYLLKRATIRYLAGNHGDALEDLQQVMRLCPTDVNAYLLAGHILVNQGHLKEALETYEIGCANVDEHDTRYEELCSVAKETGCQVDDAPQQQQQEVPKAPKKTLPFDIVSQIFEMVPVSTRIQLAATCKAWRRDLLSGWPGMWRSIELDGAAIRNKDVVLSNIPGDKVREVKFAIREKTMMRDALKDIVKYNWNQVETIGKCYLSHGGFFVLLMANIPYFVDITAQMGSQRGLQDLMMLNATSLKHIRICQMASHFDSTSISWLMGIFQLCPNLESFVCDIRIIINPSATTPTSPHTDIHFESPLHLKQLCLMTTSLTHMLPQLLYHCPDLEKLTLDPSSYIHDQRWMDRLLDTLEDRCPKLSKLAFKTWMDNRDIAGSIISPAGIASNTTTVGLREICHDVQHTTTPTRSLRRLINKHGSTLYSFQVNIHNTASTSTPDGNEDEYSRSSYAACLMLLSLVRSNNLSNLHLTLDQGNTDSAKQPALLTAIQLASLLGSLQALEVVYLRSTTVNHHVVFEALASLERLRQLDIGTINWRQCSIRGIRTFFSQARALSDVTIIGEVDDKILCAAQYSSSLQRLSFGNYPHRISEEGVACFSDCMFESKLTHLSLKASTRYMEFKDLMPLIRLPMLSKVELFDCDITNDEPASSGAFQPIFQFIRSSRNGAMLTVVVNAQAYYYNISMVGKIGNNDNNSTSKKKRFRVVSRRMFSQVSSTEYYDM